MSHCVVDHAVRPQPDGDRTHHVTSTAQPIRVSNSVLAGPTKTGSSHSPSNPTKDHSNHDVASSGDHPDAVNEGITTRFAQIREEFVDSLTNAISRFHDKHPESTKSVAECSVFEALGYDPSTETPLEWKAPSTRSRAGSFSDEVHHYRVHHIMRSRDAIRTLRIKAVYERVLQQFPSYSPQDVLINLSEKLNALFLPSPSPPPPTPVHVACSNRDDTICATKHCTESADTLGNGRDESVNDDDIESKLRTASRSLHNIDNVVTARLSNESMQSLTSLLEEANKRLIPSASEIQVSVEEQNRDSVDARSLTAVSDEAIHGSHHRALKQPAIYLTNIMDIGHPELFGQQAQHYLVRSTPNTAGSSSYVHEEDEVDKKFKLHQKSRKRKYQPPGVGVNALNALDHGTMNGVDAAPPTKRHRAHGVFKGKGKGRKRGKGKGKRGRGGKNRNKYHHQNVRRRNNNSDNYSTDVFEDEEDDGSDIDLNNQRAINSTNSLNQRSIATTSTNSSHRR